MFDKIFSSRWFRHSGLRLQLLMGKYGPYFDMSDREKMISLALRFARIHKIEGNYYEFSLGEGYTFGNAIAISKHLGMDIGFNAFDSFHGIPETTGIDISDQFKKGDYAFSKETFLKNIPKTKRLTIVEGWYKDTLTEELKNKMNPAAVVWIDCDLYESTIQVLNWITHKLVEGSILIFDDWYCFKGDPTKGEAAAFEDW